MKASRMQSIGHKTNPFSVFSFISLVTFFFLAFSAYSAEVGSWEELKPFLNQDNVNVTLAAGICTISASDIEEGKLSNPLFLFEGNNSAYDTQE